MKQKWWQIVIAKGEKYILHSWKGEYLRIDYEIENIAFIFVILKIYANYFHRNFGNEIKNDNYFNIKARK